MAAWALWTNQHIFALAEADIADAAGAALITWVRAPRNFLQEHPFPACHMDSSQVDNSVLTVAWRAMS